MISQQAYSRTLSKSKQKANGRMKTDTFGRALHVGDIICSSKIWPTGVLRLGYIVKLGNNTFNYIPFTGHYDERTAGLQGSGIRRWNLSWNLRMSYFSGKTMILPKLMLPPDIQNLIDQQLDDEYRVVRNSIGFVEGLNG